MSQSSKKVESKKFTPVKKWTSVIVGENIIFSQKSKTLTVPVSNIEKYMMDEINTNKICGGCQDLPTHGYSSDKFGWCSFSRGIANLYDEGFHWIDDEPAKKYLFIVSKLSLKGATELFTQTFYTFTGKQKALKKRTRCMKKMIVTNTSLTWTTKDKKCPYKVGYLNGHDGLLRSMYGASICPIKDGDLVMVDNSDVAHMLSIRELKDGEASFSLYQ